MCTVHVVKWHCNAVCSVNFQYQNRREKTLQTELNNGEAFVFMIIFYIVARLLWMTFDFNSEILFAKVGT